MSKMINYQRVLMLCLHAPSSMRDSRGTGERLEYKQDNEPFLGFERWSQVRLVDHAKGTWE
jgi:hypothetical protein